jgi:hypothetical protein
MEHNQRLCEVAPLQFCQARVKLYFYNVYLITQLKKNTQYLRNMSNQAKKDIPIEGIITLASQLIELIKTGIEKRGLLRERVNRLEQALLKAAEYNLVQDERIKALEEK